MANGTFSSDVRALIVENSIVVQYLYMRILSSLQFDVVAVKDEYEALELLETDKDFDFMIIDAGRPSIDGEEVIMFLKELAPEVKIIVSTFEMDLADGLLAAGADAFIVKPAQRGDIIIALISLGIIG